MVCQIEDQYVSERVKWIVQLSDGTYVFQDDERPGVYPYSAWTRLKNHLKGSNKFIVRMHLEFRSNRKENAAMANAQAYFFCKQAIGSIGMGEKDTIGCYLVGNLHENGLVIVQQYRVPELILAGEEYRNLDHPGMADCLIKREDSYGTGLL